MSIGYAAGSGSLGWAAALMVALTAYVRVFGGALGQPQCFAGPMAKQHRMAVATVALLSTFTLMVSPATLLWAALIVIRRHP